MYHNIVFYDCIVNCEWSNWTIGNCTESCGGGVRTSTGTEKVSSAHGGEKCKGDSFIPERCNDQECPGNGNQVCTIIP